MDESMLLNGVLRSVLGGRGRHSHRTLNYLTGGGRGSFWTNPSTLLTAAGMAWGIFETMQNSGTSGAPPPLPNVGSQAQPASPESLRIVRLAISAANADGTMSDVERAAIVDQARKAGIGDIVEAEMQQPRPLAEIVSGVSDTNQRATMYVLAYSMARGDEQPGGAERIYLAQLANLLGIDAATVQQLEQTAASRIDAQPA